MKTTIRSIGTVLLIISACGLFAQSHGPSFPPSPWCPPYCEWEGRSSVAPIEQFGILAAAVNPPIPVSQRNATKGEVPLFFLKTSNRAIQAVEVFVHDGGRGAHHWLINDNGKPLMQANTVLGFQAYTAMDATSVTIMSVAFEDGSDVGTAAREVVNLRNSPSWDAYRKIGSPVFQKYVRNLPPDVRPACYHPAGEINPNCGITPPPPPTPHAWFRSPYGFFAWFSIDGFTQVSRNLKYNSIGDPYFYEHAITPGAYTINSIAACPNPNVIVPYKLSFSIAAVTGAYCAPTSYLYHASLDVNAQILYGPNGLGSLPNASQRWGMIASGIMTPIGLPDIESSIVDSCELLAPQIKQGGFGIC